MKRQFERYFELFPILAIVFILMAGENHRSKLQSVGIERSAFELSVPTMDVQVPRFIFR